MKKTLMFMLALTLSLQLAGVSLAAENASDSGDVTPPVLVSLEMDEFEVVAPGSIELTAVVTDDLSGVSSVCLEYWHRMLKENGPTYAINLQEAAGSYKGTLETGPYMPQGVWEIKQITLVDKAGNRIVIDQDTWIPGQQYELSDLDLSVINENEDADPPQLVSISIDQAQVQAGGSVRVTAEITDDGSGVERACVVYGNKGAGLTAVLEKDEGDTYKGELAIGPSTVNGLWTLKALETRDKIGNTGLYEPQEELDFSDVAFTVLGGLDADFVTNTSNPNLVRDIQASGEDAVIVLACAEGAIVAKEVFSAIKGTQRSIILSADGVEWLFKGGDISKALDFDPSAQMKLIDQYTGPYAQQLKAICGDVSAHAISVSSEELPGKARFRIKADAFGAAQSLFSYGYDAAKNTLAATAKPASFSAAEAYVELEISGGGLYLVAGQEIKPKASGTGPKLPSIPYVGLGEVKEAEPEVSQEQQKAPEQEALPYEVVCRKLNIRSGPGTTYERVGQLTRGGTVAVVEVIDDAWARIRTDDGEAYISMAYVKRIRTDWEGQSAQVAASRLNVRTGPSLDGNIIGRLNKGIQVQVLSVQEGWARLAYDGGEGYVALEYLR